MSDARTMEGATTEVRKVRDRADKLAEGEYPKGADHVLVLAGMIGNSPIRSNGSPVGSATTPTRPPLADPV